MRSARGIVRAAVRRLAGRDGRSRIVFPDGSDPTRDKTVQFFRQFIRFHGGHMKVWHYYNHVAVSGTYTPFVRFSADSVWDEWNPWNTNGQRIVPATELAVDPDVYFLAGLDWTELDQTVRDRSSIPVINLIQNARHADPGDETFSFLRHKAIRICVDPAVERAITATGIVVGPVFTVPNAVDVEPIPDAVTEQRGVDVLIVGLKRPEIAGRLHDALAPRSLRSELIDRLVPRPALLGAMRRAKVTVFLPNPEEGSYLPPVEGMAMATIAVCPDIVGASDCRDGVNSFRPAYTDADIFDAVERALAMDGAERQAMIEAGFDTVRTHDPRRERAMFLDILRRADELWHGSS